MHGKMYMGSQVWGARTWVALAISVLVVIISYYPVLAPILDSRLQFAHGDFTTFGGYDSGSARKDFTFSTFADGYLRRGTNRFLLLAWPSILSEWVVFSDTQFISALILLSVLLGSLGIAGIVRRFGEEGWHSAALILLLVMFYFLNLWSVERIEHVWIWFSYGIFPLLVSLGISYVHERRMSTLMLYSVLFSCYGFAPHSLGYVLIIHLFLVAYATLTGGGKGRVARMAFIPAAVFLLLSAPIIAVLLAKDGLAYPYEVTMESVGYLSRNGDMINLLTFTNNWMPQLPSSAIYSNMGFRHSALAIFIAAFSFFALSFRKLRGEAAAAALLSAFAILGAMFLAQGANNSAIAYASEAVVDLGMEALLGPLREWARISIMIPVFMSVIFSACAPRMPFRSIVLAALAFILIANIALSPSWDYLNKAHAAVSMGDEFSMLKERIPAESKVMWIGQRQEGMPAISLGGEQVRRGLPLPSGAGSTYPAAESTILSRAAAAPKDILDALNIHHVIMRDGARIPDAYSHMACEKIGCLQLCTDGATAEPFRAYDSASAPGSGILEPGPAAIVSYERISPTRWKARVNASDRFILGFAETYSPEWHARVTGANGTGDAIRPVVLYGLVNGYRINQTGDLEVELRYAPQDAFEAGMWITIVTFISCTALFAHSLCMEAGGKKGGAAGGAANAH